jgi:uncharacterized protein YqhQ
LSNKFHYGGQAVIEGVMIRGQNSAVTTVRRSNGELASSVDPTTAPHKSWIRKTPFIRGVVVLIESLVLGIKALLRSANMSLEEEGEEGEQISGGLVWIMLLVSIGIAVALFFVAPLYLSKLIQPFITSSLLFHFIEGLIRLAIFVLYLGGVGLLPDIKRVFAYHGAEHMAVNAYEGGIPLEVEAVRKYSTAHTRCGTSFIFVVLVIAILVFSFVGFTSTWLMLLSRILLLPVIAAISYEIIYFSARHADNLLVKAIMSPGMALQSLTTRQPDDRQLEVGIASLKKALEIDHPELVEKEKPTVEPAEAPTD